MRICKVCGSTENPFEPNRHTCRECRNGYKIGNTRTKDGHIKKIYGNQIRASKMRGHTPPEYTKVELYNWCMAQNRFHELYDIWASNGYDRTLAPSVDRVDDSKGYTYGNIRLVTWAENDAQAHKDCKIGLLNMGNKSIQVKQYTLQGEYIKTFPTVRNAARELERDCHKEILMCCRGKRKQTHGYKWQFKGGPV